jgi:hypothetical protein
VQGENHFGQAVIGAAIILLGLWVLWIYWLLDISAFVRRYGLKFRNDAGNNVADTPASPWGDVVHINPEMRPARKGVGRGKSERVGRTGIQTKPTGVQTQNSKPIQSDLGDSNSPTNLAGRGGL